jgi:hypothetical protein
MQVSIGGRVYRRVSLDSDPLFEDSDQEQRDTDRIMRERPTPPDLMQGFVTTRNGNVVQAIAR